MRVLVTGGAGFIGSHMVEGLLTAGHEVIAVDDLRSGKEENLSKDCHFIKKDILDLTAAELPDLDAIIHLAAHIDVASSMKNPFMDAEQNILGTIALLQIAREKQVQRFIFPSSSAVYGDVQQLPVTEESPTNPVSPYGLAKLTAENYIRLYHQAFGVPYTIFRYANAFGQRQWMSKESGVIGIFTQRALKNQPIKIFGDGSQTRDFVYVKDIVRANMDALKSGIDGLFHVSTNTQISLRDMVDVLQDCVGHPIEIEYEVDRRGDIKHSCLDNHKALQQLGWKPRYDFKQALMETVELEKAAKI